MLGVAEGYPGPKVLELADYREIVANAENECIGLVRSIVEPQANAYCNAQGVDDGSFLQKLTIYKTRKSQLAGKKILMPAELFTLNVWLMTKINTSVASGIVFASHKNQYNAILQSFYLLFLKEL